MGRVLGEVGELGVVAGLAQVLAAAGPSERVLVGPGDDAAVLALPTSSVVVTTDMLVEGQHFRRDWSSAADVGHKAAAQNLADVVAMGAEPVGLVVAFGAPGDLPETWATELTAGLRDEAAEAGCQVVGGDTVGTGVTGSPVVVSVAALGTLDGESVRRDGANSGDVVAVAGRLGWSAAGQAVLSRGFRSPRRVVDAHRRPQVPYAAGPAAAAGGATAMLDVSDGLVLDLSRIASASGVSIDLDSGALRPDAALEAVASAMGAEALSWVLGGGEDHALAACFPPGVELPEPFRPVGLVRAMPQGGDEHAVTLGGRPIVEGLGYQHFAQR